MSALKILSYIFCKATKLVVCLLLTVLCVAGTLKTYDVVFGPAPREIKHDLSQGKDVHGPFVIVARKNDDDHNLWLVEWKDLESFEKDFPRASYIIKPNEKPVLAGGYTPQKGMSNDTSSNEGGFSYSYKLIDSAPNLQKVEVDSPQDKYHSWFVYEVRDNKPFPILTREINIGDAFNDLPKALAAVAIGLILSVFLSIYSWRRLPL